MWRRRPPDELTPREREVLRLIRLGLTNEEIAQRLGITVAGAKYHVSEILSKFGVATREEAATWLPDRQSWLRKLVWISAAGVTLAALSGVALIVFNTDTDLIDESDVFGDENRNSLAGPPPVEGTESANRHSPASPPADIRRPLSTSPQRSANAFGLPIPTPTQTLAATPPRSGMPTPTDPGNGSPKRSGNIAFVSGSQIDVIAADGSGRTSITDGREPDLDPAWSPDSSRIAFARRTSHFYNGWDIFVANADGSTPTNLTNDNIVANSDPAWSPDGTRIAFIKHSDLWVMNADGSGATMIFGAPDAVSSGPSWSPDGSKIAFSSNLARQMSPGGMTYDIYVVNADGSQLTRLTDHPTSDYQPDWSPDGTRIAFASMRSDSYEIFLMNFDGSSQVQLTHNGGTSPSWSPDGGMIAFNRSDGRSSQDIYVIDINGTNEFNDTNSPSGEISPDWQPLAPTPTPTGPPVASSTKSPTPTQPSAGSIPLSAVIEGPALLPRSSDRVGDAAPTKSS